jgi:predicted CoA-binding protein
MDQAIKDFIQCKHIAVVGVSRSGKKFGNKAYEELKRRGYQVFAVNPAAQQIGGDTCYASLADLQGLVDGVVICIPPAQVPPILQEASDCDIKHVWLQVGASSPELVAQAKKLGLNTVADKCIMMYATPVTSFHSFHRFFVRLFGGL